MSDAAGAAAGARDAKRTVQGAKGRIYRGAGGARKGKGKDISCNRRHNGRCRQGTATKNVKEKQESTVMRLSITEKQFDEASKKEKALRDEITAALKELKE